MGISKHTGVPEDVELLLSILPIIAKCADLLDVLAVDPLNREIQFSYIRLQARCLLVAGELDRVKLLIDPAGSSITAVLHEVESLVRPSIPGYGSNLSVPSSHGRLAALQDQWFNIQQQPSFEKHRILSSWLDYGSQERNDRIGDTLKRLFQDCQEKYPEGPHKPIEEPLPQRREIVEPPYGVSDAAEAVFKSMLAVKACACHPSQKFDARLCLATHRTPDEFATNFEFNLFLSPDETWHEVQVRTTRPIITLNAKDRPKKAVFEARNKAGIKEVKELCKPITAIRNWRYRSHRLNFAVEKERLWSMKPEKQQFPIDCSEEPISLEDFIATRKTPFTDMTKRIVAVLLGHAMLHLHGTQWIQSNWGPSRVIFLPAASTIPIRPYIQVTLGADHMNPMLGTVNECDDDDFFGDDDVDQHPFPHLVMMAIMLMQIYLARTFRSFTEEFEIGDPTKLSNNENYALASQIFDKYSQVILYSEKYWCAINKCLDPYIQELEGGVLMDDIGIRKTLYDNIIGPLEDELAQGRFSSEDLVLNLDIKASNLDLANWGQEIQFEPPQHLNYNSLPSSHSPRPHAAGAMLSKSPKLQHTRRGSEEVTRAKYSQARRRAAVPSSSSIPICHNSLTHPSFFDDESAPKEILEKAYDDFRSWKEDVLEVYDQFITGSTKKELKPRIAILDTGLDMNHPDFLYDIERRQRIREHKNFTNSKRAPGDDDMYDASGHGTHVTGIILDFAPEAQVYVAKIAEHDPDDCRLVAKAIKYAVDNWQVDIISLSFGYNTRESDDYGLIERAVEYAHGKGVLLFAAASNSGANQRRTFPARHDSVICIHSTGADGIPSRFNPPPDITDNFATVGEAVESAWPSQLCIKEVNECCLAWKWGTSFATPIAAGIAAFLLQYAKENLDESDVWLLKKPQGMRALFKEISKESHGYDYVAPKIHPGNLFGKDKAYVKQRISVVLRDS